MNPLDEQPAATLPFSEQTGTEPGAAERQKLLYAWNATTLDFPHDARIHDLIAEQAARTPAAAAIIHDETVLSFAALDQRANRLGHLLQARGVGPGTLVALCLPRSRDLLISLLAVLKAGAAYLPLDPADPADRLSFILQDSRARLLIADTTTQHLLSAGKCSILNLDRAWTEISQQSAAAAPACRATADSPAYVLYTSGSTGQPKGTLITHRSLISYLCWAEHTLIADSVQWLPFVTRLSFDASLKQIFVPLLRGRAVWILPNEIVSHPPALLAAIARRQQVALNCVPTLWSALLDEIDARGIVLPAGSLVQLMLGGEHVTEELVARTLRALPELQLWNLYGPTETTANASAARLVAGDEITIGRPIANTRLYVLDQQGDLVSIGAPGELYIGGEGVAQGYLNRPDLTAERFLPDPFGDDPGARLYRTGDRVRYLPDGRLAFLGRIDHQVKLRGLRIELGEIEAVLARHPAVREAVVVLHEPPGDLGAQQLVGYVVPRAGQATNNGSDLPSALRAFLHEQLPEYMIPSLIDVRDALPLTATGKIDRRLLATRAPHSTPRPAAAQATGSGGVHRLIEAQAARTPNATAVCCEGRELSYAELNDQANRLATHLRRAGVGPEVIVGIYLDRSPELIVAILAILKAGGAYLPIEPSYPAERVEFMLHDSQAGLLLTQQRYSAALAGYAGKVLCLDAPALAADPVTSGSTAGVDVASDNLAYVIYTSGSTGRPKGVMISHGALSNFLAWLAQISPLDSADKALLKAPISFDASVLELFPPLVAGAALVVVPPDKHQDQTYLLDLIARQQVTTLFLVPSALRLLLDAPDLSERAASVRRVYSGAEAVTTELAAQFFRRLSIPLYNLYGPTEATIAATGWPQTGAQPLPDPLPIGYPGTNQAIYLLDRALREVPAGEIGEMYIGGMGVARGYLNRPDLTAEKFMADPFSSTPGTRLYKTGDLARRRADGSFEFIGRADHQVKIRGQRIELGEIEAALEALPAISQAIVAVFEPRPADQRLVAYVVPAPAQTLDEQQIRAALRETLPDYMVPALYIPLETLPQTPAGKIDRKALPAPADYLPARHSELIAPRTSVESYLAGLWAQVLGVSVVSVDDDFFTLGGHSLLATQIVTHANQRYGLGLSIAALFEHPTIADLAAVIDAAPRIERGPALSPQPRRKHEPLSFAQQRLWFFDQLMPGSALYNVPFALRLRGDLDIPALEHSLSEIVRRHEVLRTTFADIEGQPVAVIHPAQPGRLPIEDLSALEPAARMAEMHSRMRRDANQPFDLATGPLLRATLLRLSTHEHMLLLNVHHICADGWSVGVWSQELTSLYRAFRREHAQPAAAELASRLPELEIQYADFGQWQRRRLEAGDLEPQFAYWQSQLQPQGAPLLPPLDLPTDHPRPAQMTFAGSIYEFTLPADLVERVRSLSQATNATPFMVLLAAFKLLLHRYANHPDQLQVGIPIANRTHPALERLIGFFVNTLVIRTDFTGQPSFHQLVQQVRCTTLAAYDHQEVPFDKLVERLGASRDPKRPPLVQVMFVLQNGLSQSVQLPDLEIELVPTYADVARFDLTFSLTEQQSGLTGLIEYNTALFERASMIRLVEHFTWLLERVTATPDQPVAAIIQELERPAGVAEAATAAQPETDLNRSARVAARKEQLSAKKQALLQGLLRGAAQRGSREAAQVIPRRAGAEAPPLSFAQQRLWLLDQIGAGNGYNVVMAAELRGQLDLALMERSFNEIVRRHEILRTTFSLHGQQPVQIIAPALHIPLTIIHLEQRPHDAFVAAAEQQMRAELLRTFDLQAGPLVYVTMLCGDEQTYRLIVNIHHIIADAWSVDMLMKEMGAVYEALRQGRESPLPPLPIQYADYAVWQRQQLRDEVVEQQLSYWQARLANLPSALALPTDRPRPSVMSHRGAAHRFAVDQQIVTQIRALSQQTRTTHFMVYLAAFQALLAHYTAQTDIVVGSPIAHRPHPETEPLIGFFLNTLVLRTDLADDPSLLALLERVKSMMLEAQAHQDLPFERLVEALNPPRDPSRTPLFQVMFVLNQALPLPGDATPSFTMRLLPVDYLSAKFDLTLAITESADGAEGLIGYSSDLFDAESIAALSRHFLLLLARATQNPAAGVLSLPILSAEEQALLQARRLQPQSLSAPARELLAPRDELEERLIALWRALLAVPALGITDDFFALGGHSLLAMRMITQVHEHFDVVVPLRRFFDMPTIAGLATMIAETRHTGFADAPPIRPVGHDEPLPLSFGQQRLWFLHQLEESSSYNVVSPLHLQGPLSAVILQRCFNELIRRHTILRTRYVMQNGEPLQEILPALDLPLRLIDLTDVAAAERPHRARRIIAETSAQCFDLASGPLLTTTLLKLAEDEHVLILVLHHSIVDMWSLELLKHEMGLLYQAFSLDEPSPLLEPELQYADFAVWQRDWMQGRIFTEQLAYWTNQLHGLANLDLPADHPRPPISTYRGALHSFELPADQAAAVQQLSRSLGVTLFMTYLAAFKVLLKRYTGQRDIAVGTPIANRAQPGTEHMQGFFLNTLVLRTDLAADLSFVDLLGRVRSTTLDAYAHQELPFERLVEELQPTRDLSRTPLFQVLFVLTHQETQASPFSGLSVEQFATEHTSSKFDLTLFINETPQGLTCMIEYSTDLFEAATIVRMGQQLQRLLEAIVANPEQRITDLPLLSAAEQQQILHDWNRSEAEYPRDAAVHQLIEAQVERNPETAAIVYEGASLSYAELNARANQLAHYLRAQGVGPDVLVALMVERGLEMIVGMLAILKAGGAYVPLDPNYPADRLQYMLGHSQAPVLLTQDRLVGNLPNHSAQIFRLDADWERLAAYPATNPARTALPEHLAYIIYTSGSTGRPKGVMVKQQGLINLVHGLRAYFDDPQVQITGLITSISFDISVNQIFPTLIFGRTLHIISDEIKFNSRVLLRYLNDQQIHLLDAVPSYMQAVLNEVAPEQPANALRYLLIGGEKIEQRLLQSVFGQFGSTVEIINIYGLTEISDINILGPIRAEDVGKPITVGRPLQNNRIYIVDDHMQPQPIGIAGEVCVSGESVSRGYLFRPELTAERFVVCPFEDGQIMVRTGDLGRWRDDGTVEILGRIDHQVKVRGFRIETGEIEHALAQHPDINECVVVVREDAKGEKHLVAYVVKNREPRTKNQGDGSEAGSRSPGGHPVLGSADLRQRVGAQLPDYMIPSLFVELATLPKTPSGKIDRKALPAPNTTIDDPSALIAPRDALERQLVAVWEGVLGHAPIGVTHNFFALGGHSLLAARLVNELRAALEKEIPLALLLQNPTVEQLAAALRGTTAPAATPLVGLRTRGSRPPLFLIHPGGGQVLAYSRLVELMPHDQPIYGLQSSGLGGTTVHTTIEQMASAYLAAIREIAPHGPYLLGGWSLGGLIALEMAQQLRRTGERATLVAMIDTYAPLPEEQAAPESVDETDLLRMFIQDLGLDLPDSDSPAADNPADQLDASIQQAIQLGKLPSTLNPGDIRDLFTIFKTNYHAMLRYHPQSYTEDVLLIRASETSDPRVPEDRGWRHWIRGRLTIHQAPGSHFTMLRQPLGEHVAALLSRYLADAQAGDNV
ncbi:MAG TPA: amino acid adenylation domain-containing protein [Herpetosiphonaceae bacterium]